MKSFNQLDFVSLAKSTDKTRINLMHVWGSGKEIVATDGYRVHLAPSSLNGWIDSPGLDAEFPQYELVLPTTEPIRVIPNLLRDELVAFILTCSKSTKDKQPVMLFTFEGSEVKISFHDELGNFTITSDYKVTFETPIAEKTLVGINAHFLADVIKYASKCEGYMQLAASFHGSRGPLKLEVVTSKGIEASAIIMPMRV